MPPVCRKKGFTSSTDGCGRPLERDTMKPAAGEKPSDYVKKEDSASDEDSRSSNIQHGPRPLNEYEGTVPSFFKDQKGQSQMGILGSADPKRCLKLQLKSVRSEAASRWRKHLLAKVDEDVCAGAAECGGNRLGERRDTAPVRGTGLEEGSNKDGLDIRAEEYKLQGNNLLFFDLFMRPLADLRIGSRNRTARQSQVGKLRHDRMGHGYGVKHWLDRYQRQSDHNEEGQEEPNLHGEHHKGGAVRMFKEKQERHIKKPASKHSQNRRRSSRNVTKLACPESTRAHDTVRKKGKREVQGQWQVQDNGEPEMKSRTQQTQDHHGTCTENQDLKRDQGQGQGQCQECTSLLLPDTASQDTGWHPLRRTKAYLTLLSLSNISLGESELADISASESNESLEAYKEPAKSKLSSQETNHAAGRNSSAVSRKEVFRADTDHGHSDVCSPASRSARHGAVPASKSDSTDASAESALFPEPTPASIFTGRNINGYDFGKIFSGGASSVIFKVKKGGTTYAAKVFKRIHPYEERLLKISKREYKIMKKLKHPHIVKVYDYFVFRLHGVIIMEYVQTSELWKFLDKSNCVMSLSVLKNILWDILSALRHIHKHRISHMDVKTNNILVDRRGCAKITDFGGAVKFGRFFSKRHAVNFFTPDFAPPEKQWQRESGDVCVVHYKRYDMWSVGVMLYHMYTGRLPYALPEGKLYLPAKLFTGVVDLPPGVKQDAEFLSLVRQCMQVDPLDRITAKEAIAHPFFDSVRHKGLKK
ncbi:cyclin-dependent kinase 11B-like [Haliotis rubra]|uniref:cyclin-dependent kinase 11B-like n=1 Tax=Haliotis rubra TaxID=36100 RepID=UPI001EE51A13|nr:cyclin-dependent kinase 11B-like [Haliotis rubra]